jgi:hypothetical protein
VSHARRAKYAHHGAAAQKQATMEKTVRCDGFQVGPWLLWL